MGNKVVLWNGPKLVGKDVAINHLRSLGLDFVVRECKDSLHKITQLLFCVSLERYWEIYNDRSLKEVPLKEFRIKLSMNELDKLKDIVDTIDIDSPFQGVTYHSDPFTRNVEFIEVNLSIRSAMIYSSEIICKPRFGEDYFGRSRASEIKDGEIVFDGSCGFVEELGPLLAKVPMNDILLLRIHREGFTFDGDSRYYIPDGVIKNTVDIHNNGSEESYFKEVEHYVRKFLQ